MVAVDFTGWVYPDLVLTLGGGTYRVSPPDVNRAKRILALAVREEVRLGLYTGETPKELQAAMDELLEDGVTPGEVTLGSAVYAQMLEDQVPVVTVERVAYYAMFYWARGKGRADALAEILWKPAEAQEDDSTGKAQGR